MSLWQNDALARIDPANFFADDARRKCRDRGVFSGLPPIQWPSTCHGRGKDYSGAPEVLKCVVWVGGCWGLVLAMARGVFW